MCRKKIHLYLYIVQAKDSYGLGRLISLYSTDKIQCKIKCPDVAILME